MNTLDAIYARRAVKQYDPDYVMPEEDVRKLFEAAIQSPTSFNIQHWRFVLVRDRELRGKIRDSMGLADVIRRVAVGVHPGVDLDAVHSGIRRGLHRHGGVWDLNAIHAREPMTAPTNGSNELERLRPHAV